MKELYQKYVEKYLDPCLAAVVLGTIFLCILSRCENKDDNIYEELAEEIIRKKTDINIDLSPETLEQ